MYYNIKNIITTSNQWKNDNIPIYQNLYKILKNEIITNGAPENLKLPATRKLAKDLNISRSTVNKVYELLLLEKHIISKQGAGYYILPKKNELEKITADTNSEKKYKYPTISKRAKLFSKYRYISTDNYSKDSVAFRPGLPPLDLFPVKTWKTISNKYWRESTPTNLSYAPSEGLETLRVNIATYLKIYRNINCDHKQIIIVSGSLHSLYLIGNSIINKGDRIVMENPTFPRAHNLFKSLKANIIACDLDTEGINIDSIPKEKTKLIYTTPSNQYPSGVKMSHQRRLELLDWAKNQNSLIIEDDYDHEFSNWEKPIPSIFSLDTQNRVIYQGTFNKLLHPSLRLGYMIVPNYLIESIKAIYEQSSRFVPSSTQAIMSEFISNEHLNKHLRNVIKTSNERRNLFIELTKKTLDINKSNEGLHLIAKIKSNIPDIEAFKKLQDQNVIAYPLSNYYITKQKKDGLVLGYSSVNNKVMKEKTSIINKLLKI